jgi:hypothetical protein
MNNSIREEIMAIFPKYCRKCDGLCCKKGDLTLFDWELDKLKVDKKNIVFKNQWGSKEKSKDIKVQRINLGKICPFLKVDRCGLKLKEKPLDCLTYPIFPILKYHKTEKKEIIGMMIHKTCPLALEISKDKDLVGLIRKLWREELESIRKDDLRHWFGNKRNYWLDKNVYKTEN